MLASLIVFLASGQPIGFPGAPIASELARGEAIYYARKGIDRVLMEDRKVVGKWFDGTLRRDMDEVIWISPRLLSRWVGYLNAKEKWSVDELAGRWQRITDDFGAEMVFVAQIYALPKQSILELTDEARSRPETALDARFLVTWPAKNVGNDRHEEGENGQKRREAPLVRLEPRVDRIGKIRGYSLDTVQKWPWYALDPLFFPLAPEFGDRRPGLYDGVVGDFVRAVYLIRVPIPGAEPPAGRLDVRIFVPGKEPVAKFDLTAVAK